MNNSTQVSQFMNFIKTEFINKYTRLGQSLREIVLDVIIMWIKAKKSISLLVRGMRITIQNMNLNYVINNCDEKNKYFLCINGP